MATALLILLPLIALLLLPAYFMMILWRKRQDEPWRWFLTVLYTSVYLAYICVTGPWDLVGYYLRYLWPVIFLVVILRSIREIKAKPMRIDVGVQTWVDLLILAVFTGFLVVSLKGFGYADEPVELAFPLASGQYYIGQGGNSPLLNYHNSHPSQRYALDITALNTVGLRARGLYPSDPNRYVIYGEPVHSPCNGTITVAVDDLPDLNPPAADPDNLAGNHVIIHCHGVNVLLAHLQQDSVAVETGEEVTAGQMLGRVGNSGNTSEPHLHIHAVRADTPDTFEGQGVPILFDHHFAVRNNVLNGKLTARP